MVCDKTDLFYGLLVRPVSLEKTEDAGLALALLEQLRQQCDTCLELFSVPGIVSVTRLTCAFKIRKECSVTIVNILSTLTL
jgi:hypothetical protein